MAEGRRAQRTTGSKSSSPLAHLAALGFGALLTGVAWYILVRAAVDFGGAALDGRSAAWIFAVGAALGAVVCLMLMLALIGRGMRTLGFISDYKPRRAAARRRR